MNTRRELSRDESPLVLLTMASSRFECDAIKALLDSSGIAVMQWAAGGSRPHIDDNSLYVRSSDLADARALLDAPVDWPE